MYQIPVSFHFSVEFSAGSGGEDNFFQEVTGLNAEVTTEEFREGGRNEHGYKIPTGVKYGNLVLKRGMFNDSEVAKWCRKAIENFEFEPRDITVKLLDEEHNPLASWSFIRAYPLKWSISDFKAQDNSLVIESLELAYASFRKD
jgi:phage tail-like protein